MQDALNVFLKDKKIRAWLDENDPKAVEQAERALAEHRLLEPGEVQGSWEKTIYTLPELHGGCYAVMSYDGKQVLGQLNIFTQYDGDRNLIIDFCDVERHWDKRAVLVFDKNHQQGNPERLETEGTVLSIDLRKESSD